MKQLGCLFCLVCYSLLVESAEKREWLPGLRQTLAQNWQLQSSVLTRDDGSVISALEYRPEHWLPASVPTTVLNALVKNLPDSAAAHAGLRIDDRILTIGSEPIHTFEDIQRTIAAHPAENLTVVIRRGDADMQVPVLIGERDAGGGTKVGVLGIAGGRVDYQRLSLPEALWGGLTQTWQVTHETIIGVAQMISGRRGTEDLGGPLRIAQLSGQVAQLGLASMISFIAILSVNLGLINLFPIPVLDGGHLLFYLAEAIRGRPLPPRAQEYGFRAGLVFLAGLFVFATWNDLTRLGIFHWVARLIG